MINLFGSDDMPAGRPKIEVDWAHIEKLAHIQCTIEEVVAVTGISHDTLDRRSKEEYGINFADFLRQKKEGGKASLRRRQWLSAIEDKNTTMMIWLGKQYLAQSDKQETKLTDDKPKKLIIEMDHGDGSAD
jgi:hypothetical protein